MAGGHFKLPEPETASCVEPGLHVVGGNGLIDLKSELDGVRFNDAFLLVYPIVCVACIDGSGWTIVPVRNEKVFVNCPECNPLGFKLKPATCEVCGFTSSFCECTN